MDIVKLRDDAEHTLGKHNCPYALRVCHAFLSLTDPTPLTVERLVEVGFVVKSAKLETWIRDELIALTQDGQFTFQTIHRSYVWPHPRTVGELNQLLLRMETP